MAAREGEQGHPARLLSRALEARLRETLQRVLEEIPINGASGQQCTITTLQVGGEALAIVRLDAHATESLSRRQREITILVASGLTNKEIASRLRLRRPTIAAHLQRIFRKLDISTRAALAGIAPLLP